MLQGMFTAVVTPFTAEERVDYDTFEALIERQIQAGVDGIVPVGTTGESPTLTHEEHVAVVNFAVRVVNGRVKVIAGSGSNATAEAVALTEKAMAAGVDASLQITPYYNKPSQDGLLRHFSTVADVGLPIVLYNVPGRTSREIAVETVVRLAEHPNITALKEAGGSVDRVSQIVNRCGITVLSGDDGLAFPMMAVGAKGVISVASNVIPAELTRMTHLALDGNWDEAHTLHRKYLALFGDLFVDTNPIPVKAAMNMMGLMQETYRLPLCAMSAEDRERLRGTLNSLHLL